MAGSRVHTVSSGAWNTVVDRRESSASRIVRPVDVGITLGGAPGAALGGADPPEAQALVKARSAGRMDRDIGRSACLKFTHSCRPSSVASCTRAEATG